MIVIGSQKISLEDFLRVSDHGEKVVLAKSAGRDLEKSRSALEKLSVKDIPIYGVTTGIGAFKNTKIGYDLLRKLQVNILRSHSVGVGAYLSPAVVRGIIFLMANSLAKGYSGVRVSVVNKLLELLNKNIIPAVPEKGSVGASGDLAPSAHIGIVLLGEGFVLNKNGSVSKAKPFLKNKDFLPVELETKEALALVNNTTTMTSIGLISLFRSLKICDVADEVGALSLQALGGTNRAFDRRIHKVKAHPGQSQSARQIRRFLRGSDMIHRERIQDSYSFRCMPQVHGAVRDCLKFIRSILEIEMNSVTDNPLIFTGKETDVISGGNFHGEHVAFAMDLLAISISEIGNISDRRIATLLDPSHNNGLPAFLIESGGLNSGLMILQYTTASLVSENKVLSHPASVDSIPTSANVEDHVSMGTVAARKGIEVLDNVEYVLAIEALCAAQACDFKMQDGKRLSKESQTTYSRVRSVVPFIKEDRYLSSKIEILREKLFSI